MTLNTFILSCLFGVSVVGSVYGQFSSYDAGCTSSTNDLPDQIITYGASHQWSTCTYSGFQTNFYNGTTLGDNFSWGNTNDLNNPEYANIPGWTIPWGGEALLGLTYSCGGYGGDCGGDGSMSCDMAYGLNQYLMGVDDPTTVYTENHGSTFFSASSVDNSE